MDVNIVFLNDDLDEEIYIQQSKNLYQQDIKKKACKLVKSFYGLIESPKQWDKKFGKVVISSIFDLNNIDKCVYNKFH